MTTPRLLSNPKRLLVAFVITALIGGGAAPAAHAGKPPKSTDTQTTSGAGKKWG